MTSSVGRRLVERWRADGLAVRAGCLASELAAFEQQHAVVLAGDMRGYFEAVDGMEESQQDPRGFWFCPLRRLCSAADELQRYDFDAKLFHGAARMYVFADYLQWSWAYAVDFSGRGRMGQVVVLGTDEPVVLAETFGEFVDLYLADSDALYVG